MASPMNFWTVLFMVHRHRGQKILRVFSLGGIELIGNTKHPADTEALLNLKLNTKTQ